MTRNRGIDEWVMTRNRGIDEWVMTRNRGIDEWVMTRNRGMDEKIITKITDLILLPILYPVSVCVIPNNLTVLRVAGLFQFLY